MTHEDTFRLRDRFQPLSQGDEIDPATLPGVKLKVPTWRDGTPKKLVAIKCLVTGAWAGHASGEFEVTPATLYQCVQNFDKRGIPLPWDKNHLSESSDPEAMALDEALGWCHKLVIGPDGRCLYSYTEWLDDTREDIREGRLGFCSPALRLGSTDAVTGQPQGARISSLACVNTPFLAQLPGLVAASDKVPVDQTIKLRDQAAQILTLTGKLREADHGRAAAEGLVRELHDRASAAETKLTALEKRVAELDAGEEERLLTERWQTWRSSKSMSIDSMRALLRSDRKLFDAEFPFVDADQRHLLGQLTPPAPKDAGSSGLQFVDLVDSHMRRGASYQEAIVLASKEV